MRNVIGSIEQIKRKKKILLMNGCLHVLLWAIVGYAVIAVFPIMLYIILGYCIIRLLVGNKSSDI